MSGQKNGSMDMVHGPLVRNVIAFALPLMLSNLLQRLFHATDTLVVGRFISSEALAAVGAGGPMISLFVWGLNGFSVGADVLISTLYGQRNPKEISRAVHNCYGVALLAGGLFTCISQMFMRQILHLMGVPEEVFDAALLYCRIYLASLIFTGVYDFGAAILRSGGDTKRPTLFLAISGVLNMVLDVLFVVPLHWGVMGAALATFLSQVLSCVLVTVVLMRSRNENHLDLRRIRLDRIIVRKLLSVGIPSSVQSIMFSFSNMIVQSSVNSFGADAIAANSAALTLEDFVYVTTSAFTQACVTFTGQNAGSGNLPRIRKVLVLTLCLSASTGFAIGFLNYHFGTYLLAFFSDKPEVIHLGLYRLHYVAVFLFLNGVMDIFVSSMRGMGYSTRPTLVTLTTICGSRIIYILTYFRTHHTLEVLYWCFPMSWLIAIACQIVLWFFLYRKFSRCIPAVSR